MPHAETTKTNAKRGYLPDDDKKFSPQALATMQTASRHVFYLINEGYDIKTASTFVGNHFKLSERQRLAIVRSIATAEQLNVRKAKELTSVAGADVWIDGFNTIITLEVMLSNSMLFSCMDGTIRDLAALRGTYRMIPETAEAAQVLFEQLTVQGVASAHILLDEPVSNSGRLKSLLADVKEELGTTCPFDLDIQIIKEVDRTLWEKANVITADAIILDHCVSWFNLMARCAERRTVKTLKVWE
ncbi:MAG: DUF434 domain-containing protein [Bacteroidales bacterium]|nr:DUF434 domain-containing protein [Bacteroidales bacterium]